MAGLVHLFDGSTGDLLHTFHSPNPIDSGKFGWFVAAFGDDILIELTDGSSHTLPLVGMVNDQATGRGDPSSNSNAYISTETLRWLGMGGYFNRLYITVEEGDNEDTIAEIAFVVEEKVERNGRVVYRSEIGVSDEHPFGTIKAWMGSTHFS